MAAAIPFQEGPKLGRAAAAGSRATHRLDKQVSHLLLGVPGLHTVPHLLKELFVVLQELRDLVEDLVHQRRVTQQGVLWLLQRLHVALGVPHRSVRVPSEGWHPNPPAWVHTKPPGPVTQWPCLPDLPH